MTFPLRRRSTENGRSLARAKSAEGTNELLGGHCGKCRIKVSDRKCSPRHDWIKPHWSAYGRDASPPSLACREVRPSGASARRPSKWPLMFWPGTTRESRDALPF